MSEDDRPNWREIDRMKDRSRHYGRPYEKSEKKVNPYADRYITGKRKEAINRLLLGEKGTLEHDKMLNKIHSSYGTNSFIKNIKKYIEKYGLPDDASTLLLILDCGHIDYTLSALEKLNELMDTLTPREKQAFKTKLNILKMAGKAIEIKEKSKEILETLNL